MDSRIRRFGWQETGFIFMLLERKPEVGAVKYGEEYAGNAKFCIQNFRLFFLYLEGILALEQQ